MSWRRRRTCRRTPGRSPRLAGTCRSGLSGPWAHKGTRCAAPCRPPGKHPPWSTGAAAARLTSTASSRSAATGCHPGAFDWVTSAIPKLASSPTREGVICGRPRCNQLRCLRAGLKSHGGLQRRHGNVCAPRLGDFESRGSSLTSVLHYRRAVLFGGCLLGARYLGDRRVAI